MSNPINMQIPNTNSEGRELRTEIQLTGKQQNYKN